jgi:hypothetical protein
MATTDELLIALIKDCRKPEDLIGENGLLKQLLDMSADRSLQGTMADPSIYSTQKERR